MRRLLHGLLVAAIAGLASTTAQAGLFDDDEARRQVAVERQRVDEMSSRVSAQSQLLETVAGRLAKIEEAVGKNQGLLDLFREIEGLKQELAKMRGQVEVLNNGIETTQKRQKDLYVDLDTRLRRLESPPVAAPTTVDPATAGLAGVPGATTPPQGAGPPPNTAEARAYDSAQNLRRIGNYQGAIVAFQNFIKQYPRSPLASSAQYWIGDSYYNMRDFRLAIVSQRAVLKNYPESAKVPDALLNIASSQLELGETAAARKTMEEIVAKHPSSDAAEKARRRIASLK